MRDRQMGADPEPPRSDEFVRVAGAQNQSEGEFIQALLLDEGVHSLLRRAAGSDVPDYLAAGQRDVLVPASQASTAREVLLQADVEPSQSRSVVVDSPLRLLAGLLFVLALVTLIVWLGTELLA